MNLVLKILLGISHIDANIIKGFWFNFHITTILFSYLCFAIAFLSGIVHLLLFNEIKYKKFGIFYKRLPSLARIEKINGFSIYTGFALLTVSLISAFIWSMKGLHSPVLKDPKVFVGIITWFIYFVLIHMRLNMGWQGRRIIYISTIGFIFITLGFILIKFLFPLMH